MIYRIRANQACFRTIEFKPGFNVVLARREDDASEEDSRNGAGKSTLLDVMHFLLGSNAPPRHVLRGPAFEGWSFTMDLRIGRREISVTRETGDVSRFIVEGDLRDLPLSARERDGVASFSLARWKELLGAELFGLPLGDRPKYSPTFRALISYFVRRGVDAYLSPFEQSKKQAEWDVQVHTAFLLGLAWEEAARAAAVEGPEEGAQGLHRRRQSGRN